jgi:hypothetical protein
MFPRARSRNLCALNVAALLLMACGVGDRLHALDATAVQAMVIIEGDAGRGSAFVVKMDGKPFLVTNSHVIQGNRNVKFKNLRNVTLATGPLQIADNTDAVRGELTVADDALELEPAVDKIRIGDAVIVAGNSEGEGVVREIPGTVIGIGPERIEVDADFVDTNNGSPILLKSTGKVIGVAACLNVPRRGRAGMDSPVGFQETRRFGYRLDAVTRWITPASNDRLVVEGLKLAELENLYSSLAAVLNNNAAFVAKGGGSGLVKSEKTQQCPALAALSRAIDEFAKHHTVLRSEGDRARNATAFIARLKGIVLDDVRGLNENQFSGFDAVQLKESLTRFKEFTDWCDSTMMPAYRAAWRAGRIEPPPAAPPRPSNDTRAADAGRAASSAEMAKPLAEFLAGTKWFWEGSKDHVLEFRKDGKVDLDFWRGVVTDWKATGTNQVTFTMHRKNDDVTSVINFTDDRGAFTGTGFVKTRVIRRCPRAPAGDAGTAN